MAKSKYYVIAKSLWQGDSWSAIDGVFDSLEEAQIVAEAKADNGFNSYGMQNLKDVVLTKVVNTTTLRNTYGISKEQANESIYWTRLNDEKLAKDAAEYEAMLKSEMSRHDDMVDDEDWS